MSEIALLDTALSSVLPQKEWLLALQKQQMAEFLVRGFPLRREEKWKYTDVSAIAKQKWSHAKAPVLAETNFNVESAHRIVFVNGHFSHILSNVSSPIIFCSLHEALTKHESLIESYLKTYDANQHPFASLNAALMTPGFFLYVPEKTVIKDPIHCVFINTQENHFFISPRNILIAEAQSEVTLLEEFLSLDESHYFTNSVTQVHAERNSTICYHKLQKESSHAHHVSNLFVNQSQDSVFNYVNLSAGALLARDDVEVNLRERGAECYLHGFYSLQHDHQHSDNHIYVNHAAEHTRSVMLYKGILDKKSRAVFNGKVQVQQHAQQVKAHQANHSVLLSAQAEVNTKPELEIYADDVKCTHGATVGQLDEEALFYLCSRGIGQHEAIELLMKGFADEIVSAIKHESIRRYAAQMTGLA